MISKVNKNLDKGFTLLELLVVIAIIGILSGIILAAVSNARSRGRDAKRRSDMHQIGLALEEYYSKYGAYPISSPANGCDVDNWCRETATSNYIPGLNSFINLPADPAPHGAHGWLHTYQSVDGKTYIIQIELENADKDTCAGGATSLGCSWWTGDYYIMYSP